MNFLSTWLTAHRRRRFARSVALDALLVARRRGELTSDGLSWRRGLVWIETYLYKDENLRLVTTTEKVPWSRIKAHTVNVWSGWAEVLAYREYPLGYGSVPMWGVVRMKEVKVFREGPWAGLLRELAVRAGAEDETSCSGAGVAGSPP